MWFALVRPVTGDPQQKQGIYKRYKSTFNVSRILLDVHLAITTMPFIGTYSAIRLGFCYFI